MSRVKLIKFVIFTVVCLLSIYLSMVMLIHNSGWPINHEAYYWSYRIHYFSNAISCGDLFPMRDFACFGMGSPMPLLYHKMFNITAGCLNFGLHSIKNSTIATMVVFELIACIGLFQITKLFRMNYFQGLAIAASYPHLNYVMTNWLIRGAFAEHTALCFVVWLVWWCLYLLKRRKFHYSIVPILYAILLSHSVIAYYSIFCLFAVYAIFLFRFPYLFKKTFKRALICVGAFLVISGQLLWAIYRTGKYTYLDYLKTSKPWENYHSLTKYFYSIFKWDVFSPEVNLKFDAMYLGALAFGISILLYFRQTKKKRMFAKKDYTVIGFIGGMFLFYMWLQMPISAWFYKIIPGADFIQFPWRNLCFLTILLVAMTIFVISRTASYVKPWVLNVIVLIICSGTICINVSRPCIKLWFPPDIIEKYKVREWAEYWPKLDTRRLTDKQINMMLINYKKAGVTDCCTGNALQYSCKNTGYMKYEYQVFCPEKTTVAIPLSRFGFENVYLVAPDNSSSKLNIYRTENDPRIRFELPAGNNRIKVMLPTLWRMLW